MSHKMLEHAAQSIVASLLIKRCESAIVHMLQQHLRFDDGLGDNPPHINIAFVFKELINPAKFHSNSFGGDQTELKAVAEAAAEGITRDIKRMRQMSDEDFGGQDRNEWPRGRISNREYHIKWYLNLRRQLMKFVRG